MTEEDREILELYEYIYGELDDDDHFEFFKQGYIEGLAMQGMNPRKLKEKNERELS